MAKKLRRAPGRAMHPDEPCSTTLSLDSGFSCHPELPADDDVESKVDPVEAELRAYCRALREKVPGEEKCHREVGLNAEDVMSWWKQRRDQMPLLTDLAVKYLPLPSTSAASGRVFSRCSHVD